MNDILYLAVHDNFIGNFEDYISADQLGSDIEELIKKLGKENVLLFLLSLHGSFRDNRRKNYEADVMDFVFIELAKMCMDESAEKIGQYLEQMFFIEDIKEHLTDIDNYAKNFSKELQERLKEEKSKKRILELKATIKKQQVNARKAMATMFGEAKIYKKKTLRQLQMLHDAHAACVSAIQNLALLAEPEKLQYHIFDTPEHWHTQQFGPFEEFVQDRWGDKILPILSAVQQQLWLENQTSGIKCCNEIIGCRNLLSSDKVHSEVEVEGFFEKLNAVQRSQWEVFKVLQPPLLNHKFLTCHSLKTYDSNYADGCECKCCMVWPSLCLGPWFLMWEKMFGQQLMDFVMYHHKKIMVLKTGNYKDRQKQQIISENKEKENFNDIMMKTAKVLRQYQQLDDAPQKPFIVQDLCEFLFDERVIMQLSWSYTLLQQWLSASLHCIIQFEVASLEMRHWKILSEAAQCCADILSMITKVKEKLLLALYLLSRQALDYPNTDKHNQFPAIVMDKVVLPSLRILEWLCCGKAGIVLQELKARAFTASIESDDIVSLPTSCYTLHEELMEAYTLHYWHLLYWLHGNNKVLLPVCDMELDLEQLLQFLDKPKENKLIPFAIKPLNKEEQQVYDLCVVPSLPGPADNRAQHFLECAQKAVKKLASVGLLTKKAEKCARNLFNSKKAKAAAKGILKYESNMDVLTHGMVFSALYCSLNFLQSGIDKNENTLSALVLLSGELLEREQLIRLAAVCSSLISTDTNSVQAQCKYEQTYSHYVPFWVKSESINRETQITSSKKDFEGVTTFVNMQKSLHELTAASEKFSRDQFWAYIDSQPPDFPSTNVFKAIQIADEAGRFLIKITKDNYAVWENGQEAYKSRLECQYWMTSIINIMVNYVLQNPDVAHPQYDDVVDDDAADYTDINDGEVSYVVNELETELSDLVVDSVLSNSTGDEAMIEEDKNCETPQAAVMSEVAVQVHKESEGQIKTTNLSNETVECEKFLVVSTVELSNNNTTSVSCKTLSISEKEVTTTCNPSTETFTENMSVLAPEKETCSLQSKLDIIENKSLQVSGSLEKENMDVHAREISNNHKSSIPTCCDHTELHMDSETNKENQVQQQHHHNDIKTMCCDHQFTVNQHTPHSCAGLSQHKHHENCQHQHHPKKQLKRKKKEEKSTEEKEKLHVLEHEKIYQQQEACMKKEQMLQTVIERIKSNKFEGLVDESSSKHDLFMDFVRLLLSSFQQEFSMWLSSSPKRQQKKKYESIIEKKFDFRLAHSDGLLAQYYLSRTWDVLQAHLYVNNAYNICEPVQGYMNFNNTILSYINGKKEAYSALHPVMHKMLLSLSTEVILPFTKRVYSQLIQAWQCPLPGQELKCVPLNEMYVASQALAFFKLILDSQMLISPHTGAQKSKVEDDALQIWKYLQCIQSSIFRAVVIVEATTYDINIFEEELNNYIEECRIYLSVYWKIIQKEFKKCGKISKPALGLENEQSAVQTPKFHEVVQSFMQGQLIDLGKTLKLVQTCEEDKHISQIKKESRIKDVQWCRNCLKLEPKMNKGTFIQCTFCIEQNYSDPFYFCSTTCKDAGMCKHNIDHIEYLLSTVQL